MPAKNQVKLINLLPQEEFAASTLGRILTWLLSSFRVIVILSEVVVMGAFLSRFWLDARNADLADEIKEKEVIVSSFAQIEREFKKSQKKISAFTSQTKDEDFGMTVIETLSKNLPSDVKLTVLTVNNDLIEIKAESLTENSISAFLDLIKKEVIFADASITQLGTSKDTPAVGFTIKVARREAI